MICFFAYGLSSAYQSTSQCHAEEEYEKEKKPAKLL